MNSISFHNAIVSLLKGVLDEEHKEVKLIPDMNSSQSGGAPAIEAIEDVFQGGSIDANANDRYIEIDEPDDIMSGGAFDDNSSTDSEAEEKSSAEPEHAAAEASSIEHENKTEETVAEENPADEPEHSAAEASSIEHEELDANELEDKPKDDEGELLDENDSDELDEHDSEDALDGTGADNKEPAKIEIPEEAKDADIERDVEDADAKDADVDDAEDEHDDAEPTDAEDERANGVAADDDVDDEPNDAEPILTGGTLDKHRVIVITADTKFPYVLKQKRKK